MSAPAMDGYIRVSRVMDREGDSFISPEVQREKIEAWSKMRGVKIAAWHTDLDQSGGKLTRPGLDAMMARVRSGETGGVVVAAIDRLSRANVGEALSLVAEIHEAGAELCAIDTGIDPRGEFGEFALTILLGLARMQRRRYSAAWVDAVNKAVARGVHPAPYGAFGYDRVEGHLIPNDDAPHLLRAFRLRVEDRWSFERIAEWLNETAGQWRGRSWTAAAVKRTLARRVYLGEAFSGVGEVVNREAHPALVAEALFLAAQRPTHSYSKRGDPDDVYLLAGLVRCAGCRYVMSHAKVSGRGENGSMPIHRCRVKRTSGRCEHPAFVSAERLEAYVEAIVCEALEARAGIVTAVPDTDELSAAQDALAEARTALDAMRQDTAAKKRLGTKWLDWLEPYLQAEEDAEDDLAAIAGRRAAGFTGLTADAYRSLPRIERRAVLSSLVGAVMVRSTGGPRGRYALPLDGGRVVILWAGQEPADFPARGKFTDGGIVPFAWPEDEAEARALAA